MENANKSQETIEKINYSEEEEENVDNQHQHQHQRQHVHYNHTLPSRFPRWTAKESYEFMSGRAWHRVRDFYSDLVNGSISLSSLFPAAAANTGRQEQTSTDVTDFNDDNSLEDDTYTSNTSISTTAADRDRNGRWARVTFKIVLSYHGPSFDGWQKQPGLNTVQGLVESSLGTFVDERKAQLLKEKCKPLEGCALVAGRTDKGVTALQQVCSFYTWRKDVKPGDVEAAINKAAPGKLRVVSVSKVSREFHPNFSAKWRRYLYIFPLNDEEDMVHSSGSEQGTEKPGSVEIDGGHYAGVSEDVNEDDFKSLTINEEDKLEGAKKPRRFSVRRVDLLLRQLEGKLLSYKIFARDTKASRNIGPPTKCFLYHARAAEATLPCPTCGEGTKVMAVELVGNRFLRKMVRVLVATSVREAAVGAEEDVLVKLMDATCRRATAPPAPPDGLCLVDVGYTAFDPKSCLIP